ncbi:hypothetical protein ETH_00035875 [Eimeria tenella]|uniref:Uncharacterized protein n=1 Tax=Eimeria tenella TaxID=5802 RepID=U6L8V5_EIMTE|nr:hypothetical protein ETH_00035875 [Eimeria tenella]CDJ44964.1 hypothetical protein ETH_00035875 [Eimeria tenella]|eukprot:XP_013235711.1 hypothetical protein ETH_00035875 [Eimeria tenella]
MEDNNLDTEEEASETVETVSVHTETPVSILRSEAS